MHRSSHRRAVALAVTLAMATLAAVGCGSPTDNDTRSATQGLPDTRQSLEASIWALDGAASTPPIESRQLITLEFDGNHVSGQGGCNSYGGSFELNDHDIEIRGLASTERACADEADTAAEQAFFGALNGARSVDTGDRDRLVVKTTGGELVFRAHQRAGE